MLQFKIVKVSCNEMGCTVKAVQPISIVEPPLIRGGFKASPLIRGD